MGWKEPRSMVMRTRSRIALGSSRVTRRGVIPSHKYAVGVSRMAKNRLKIRQAVKTKTKMKSQKAKPLPNRSGSESAYQIVLPNKGLLKKFANRVRPLTYTWDANMISTGSAGRQGVFSSGSIFDRADLHNMINTATIQEFGSSTPAGYRNLQIYLQKAEVTYAFENSTNAACRLILYDILPRRDGHLSIDNTAITPGSTWNQGIVQQLSTGATTDYTQLGSKPWDSRLFNDYFKIKCTTYVDLAPGQTHWHRVKFAPHKFLDRDIIDAENSSMNTFKGLTLYTLAVVQGQPVGDSTSGVTSEATKLNVLAYGNYHYSYIANNMSTTYGVPTAATTAGTNLENLVTGGLAAYAAV